MSFEQSKVQPPKMMRVKLVDQQPPMVKRKCAQELILKRETMKYRRWMQHMIYILYLIACQLGLVTKYCEQVQGYGVQSYQPIVYDQPKIASETYHIGYTEIGIDMPTIPKQARFYQVKLLNRSIAQQPSSFDRFLRNQEGFQGLGTHLSDWFFVCHPGRSA